MSKFRCYHCNRCCKIDKYSTKEEFDLAKQALSKLEIELTGALLPDGKILWPKPCPALINGKCAIYKVRPYPCRQFLCGKQTKKDNRPWKSDGFFNMEYFHWQLKNIPEFAKVKRKIEDEAADWGLKHGWKLKRVKELLTQ